MGWVRCGQGDTGAVVAEMEPRLAGLQVATSGSIVKTVITD